VGLANLLAGNREDKKKKNTREKKKKKEVTRRLFAGYVAVACFERGEGGKEKKRPGGGKEELTVATSPHLDTRASGRTLKR